MNATVHFLDNILCIANKFYVNVVSSTDQFRICSQQQIVLIKQIYHSKDNILLTLDRHGHWCTHLISISKPQLLLFGTLSDSSPIADVFQINDKVIFVSTHFTLMYFTIPSLLSQREIPTRQFILNTPQYCCNNFLYDKGYLPENISYQVIGVCYNQILFVAYRQYNTQNYSIYTLIIKQKEHIVLSGPKSMYNVQGKIIALYPLQQNCILIQTTKKILCWGNEISIYQQMFQDKITISLGQKGIFWGTKINKNCTDIIEIQIKRITNQTNQQNKQFELQKIKIKQIPHRILQLYADTKNIQNSYMLTIQQHIMQKNSLKVINNFSKITNAILHNDPNHNLLIATKQLGKKQQTIFLSTQWIVTNIRLFLHKYPLQYCRLISSISKKHSLEFTVTNPIISTAVFTISTVPQSIHSTPQQFNLLNQNVAQKLLWADSDWTITCFQVTSIKQSLKYSVSTLFENALQCISHAVVLNNNILLIEQQQIHVFDYKLKRKFIHCFDASIKKLYRINQINIISIQLMEDHDSFDYQYYFFRVDDQKLQQLQQITFDYDYPCTICTFLIEINTSPFFVHILGPKIIFCSNDPLHRYQVNKITLQMMDLPTPKIEQQSNLLQLSNFQVVKIEQTCQFLLIGCRCLFIGKLYPKYFMPTLKIDAFKQLIIPYEEVLCVSRLLITQRIILAWSISNNVSNVVCILTETKIIQLDMGKNAISATASDYLNEQMQHILNPLGKKKIYQVVKTSKENHYLLYNQNEVKYIVQNISDLQHLSYFSLVNERFLSFRNSLAAQQLGDDQFMNIFNQKIPMKELKWVTDSFIVCLFDQYIVMLQIGKNDSLIVQQELRLQIKINSLLEKSGEKSLFVKDNQNKIYNLVEVSNGQYKLQFYCELEDQTILFAKVSEWENQQRNISFFNKSNKNNDQQIILKQDGQLIIKNNNDVKSIYI